MSSEWGEPAPVPNDSESIHDLVIADMASRKAFGLAKYGSLLQAGNGRDALKDAYEEALDLCVYLRQALQERAAGQPEDRVIDKAVRDFAMRNTPAIEPSVPDPGVRFEKFYLASCLQCEPSGPIPFYDPKRRNEWSAAHVEATGHQVVHTGT